MIAQDLKTFQQRLFKIANSIANFIRNQPIDSIDMYISQRTVSLYLPTNLKKLQAAKGKEAINLSQSAVQICQNLN